MEILESLTLDVPTGNLLTLLDPVTRAVFILRAYRFTPTQIARLRLPKSRTGVYVPYRRARQVLEPFGGRG